MISVADVDRSIAFYKHLGFEVGNTFAPEGATKPAWAWLYCGDSQLMLSAASKPIVAERPSVLFYLYTEDVATARASLVEVGLSPGEIRIEFYAPRGEFELTDPDGYILMITHT